MAKNRLKEISNNRFSVVVSSPFRVAGKLVSLTLILVALLVSVPYVCATEYTLRTYNVDFTLGEFEYFYKFPTAVSNISLSLNMTNVALLNNATSGGFYIDLFGDVANSSGIQLESLMSSGVWAISMQCYNYSGNRIVCTFEDVDYTNMSGVVTLTVDASQYYQNLTIPTLPSSSSASSNFSEGYGFAFEDSFAGFKYIAFTGYGDEGFVNATVPIVLSTFSSSENMSWGIWGIIPIVAVVAVLGMIGRKRRN